MILTKSLSYRASKYATDENSDIIQVDTDLISIFSCLQGRVSFGPGTSGNGGENIAGQWLTITTNGTANTESTFSHTLGTIPIGYIIVWRSIAGDIYQGPTTGTAWTTTTISLKGSAVSINAKLFLLK